MKGRWCKGVIFDFNRTLYCPDLGMITVEAGFVLESLHKEGMQLALISRYKKGRKILMRSILSSFIFSALVKEKEERHFESAMRCMGSGREDTLVVGDSLSEEIGIAKGMGIKCAWINRDSDGIICRREYGWEIKGIREVLEIAYGRH